MGSSGLSFSGLSKAIFGVVGVSACVKSGTSGHQVRADAPYGWAGSIQAS